MSVVYICNTVQEAGCARNVICVCVVPKNWLYCSVWLAPPFLFHFSRISYSLPNSRVRGYVFHSDFTPKWKEYIYSCPCKSFEVIWGSFYVAFTNSQPTTGERDPGTSWTGI